MNFSRAALASNIYVSSGAECSRRLKFYSITRCTLPITRQSLARLLDENKKNTFFSLARGVSDPLAASAKLFSQRGISSGLKKSRLQYKLLAVWIFSFAPSCWEKVQLYLINYEAPCDGGVELNPLKQRLFLARLFERERAKKEKQSRRIHSRKVRPLTSGTWNCIPQFQRLFRSPLCFVCVETHSLIHATILLPAKIHHCCGQRETQNTVAQHIFGCDTKGA